MRSFLRFLDNWGTKYRWISLKFGMKVVDTRHEVLWHLFRFFNLKNGIAKNIGFFKILGVKHSKFWNFEIGML